MNCACVFANREIPDFSGKPHVLIYPCSYHAMERRRNRAALILAQCALRRWTDLYAKLQNESGHVVSRKLDYNLPPADQRSRRWRPFKMRSMEINANEQLRIGIRQRQR